jgi:GntR family transcriptional regulator / MocR family aminotransferase
MFILDANGPIPLYKQLYNQIREHVLSGQLAADARLPSVRDLAGELAISRNTVQGAYEELYAEGYIYSKPRSGYFVSPLDHETVPSARPDYPAGPGLPETQVRFRYDFHPALLDPESFPAALWRKCFTDALRESSGRLSRYSDAQGEWGLRCAIREYLKRSRGVECAPEQIVICAGLQHSLDIVAQVLKKDHSVVAVEQPGYRLPRSVFRSRSYDVVPVPIGPNGLDVDALKGSGGTIAYVTPSHQLPLGSVMPVANRLKLIDWAESGDRFIIEDDYDSELRYHGKPIPSLQGLRPGANVIYVGTFSKILSPVLRVSYLVLPEALLSAYRHHFDGYFSSVSLLEQVTLARFMEQGHWERHVRRMRTIYRKKHDTLLRAVAQNFGSRAYVSGQGAGLHVVMQFFTAAPDEAELVASAKEQGIRLLPPSETCIDPEPGSLKLLLGFGGMAEAEIKEGISLLAQTWLSRVP